MELLGLEVENYARFENQFIPVSPGITILAGLNNSGKTALLKALASFSSPNSLPYERADGTSRLNLIYAVQSNDLPRFISAGQDLSQTAEKIAFIKASFQTAKPKFKSLMLVLKEGRELPWVIADRTSIQTSVFANDWHQMHSSISQNLHPDETAKNWVPGLERLEKCIFVPARREGVRSVPAQANTKLPVNGENLASYLSTLQLDHLDDFTELNNVVCAAFPYLKLINAQTTSNNVEVRVTYRDDGQIVPLYACGTGVEQLLILLTCIARSEDDAIICIDEPHSFLHPSAERAFLEFLRRFPKKTFFLATHSAILINGTSPDRVVHVARGGCSTESYLKQDRSGAISEILMQLGYENSDLLFNNRLVFVEGPTESAVMPVLLRKAGFSDRVVSSIGFPVLGGANPIKNEADLVRQILRYEKLVASVGREDLARLYLLDGDRKEGELYRMQLSSHAAFQLLTKLEIEDYLLDPAAIARALKAEGASFGLNITIHPGEIEDALAQMGDAKGSKKLEAVYASKTLNYSKVRSGKLLAEELCPNWEGVAALKKELEEFISSPQRQ